MSIVLTKKKHRPGGNFARIVPVARNAYLRVLFIFLGLHKKALEELHERFEDKKNSLLAKLKHNFGRVRDIFIRDDQRLELMSIVFETRNDGDTQQTHANFEDSIAILNNEVLFFFFSSQRLYYTKLRFRRKIKKISFT